MSTFFKQFRNGDVFPWERDFTRELVNVALPITVQSLLTALLHIIDNVMIGQLGEVELAAVTQANRITFLFQLALFGLSGGTATFVAQFWGKRDLRGVRETMGLSLCLSMLLAVLVVIPCVLFPSHLMRLLLNDEAAVAVAAQYLSIIAIGYLATAGSQCFGTVQKSTEQARLPMVAGIAAIATNTVLNYCLIFGNLGFPRLGVAGGAIATVIAGFVELLMVIIGGYVYKFATAARLSELVPRSLAFVKRYLTIAMPVIANEGLWALGVVMYSVVYGRMGTATVAAVSIFNTVQQVAFSTMRGVTNGTAVLVGKRIGADDEEGAFRTAKRMIYAAVPFGIFAGIVLLCVSLPLTGVFKVSEQVIADARSMVILCSLVIWLNQLGGLLIVGVMRAGGDVTMSLYLDAGTTWFIGVPMVALSGLVFGLPIPMVYLLSNVEALVKVILGLWRFRSRKWVHNLVR